MSVMIKINIMEIQFKDEEQKYQSEGIMRATYVKAFGKEYDSPDRRHLPLPIKLAYRVAQRKIRQDKGII